MTDTALVNQAASLVRRGRAGDQNALATLWKIGEAARAGANARAQAAFAAVRSYADRNPATEFVLGAEPPLLADTPDTALAVVPRSSEIVVTRETDPEMRKPPLPRGSLDQIHDPDLFVKVVLRACGYRHGLDGAAVALAGGPLLTQPLIKQIGFSNFGSDMTSRVFFHGVQFCAGADWPQIAGDLDSGGRRCLAVGQCVGRARKIQAVRMPGSRISEFSEVAGWEFGE